MVQHGLLPLHRAASFLRKHPSLDSLSGPGCLYLLNQLKNLPESAQLLREVAMAPAQEIQVRCTDWMHLARYQCPKAGLEESWRCIPQNHFPCVNWSVSEKNGPRASLEANPDLERSIAASMQLDVSFAKAQSLCVAAFNFETQSQSLWRELLNDLEDHVIPEAEEAVHHFCHE